MKFIAIGTKSIRADLIEAIQVFASTMTIFCQGGSQYTTDFDSGKEVKEEIYNSRNYTIFRPYATSNNQIDENSHNSVPPLLIDFILNEREFVFSTLPFFLVDYNFIVYTALSNYNISLQFRSRYNCSIL